MPACFMISSTLFLSSGGINDTQGSYVCLFSSSGILYILHDSSDHKATPLLKLSSQLPTCAIVWACFSLSSLYSSLFFTSIRLLANSVNRVSASLLSVMFLEKQAVPTITPSL